MSTDWVWLEQWGFEELRGPDGATRNYVVVDVTESSSGNRERWLIPVGQLLDLYTTLKALDEEQRRALADAERRARRP